METLALFSVNKQYCERAIAILKALLLKSQGMPSPCSDHQRRRQWCDGHREWFGRTSPGNVTARSCEAAKLEVVPTATAIALGHADHAMKNEDLGPWHHRCRGCSRQMLAVAKTMAEEQLDAAMLENTDGHDASTGDLFWFFLTSLGFHFCYNDRVSFHRWIGLIAFHCYIHCYPDLVIHLPVNLHRHSNEWNITGSIGTCHFRVPECTSPIERSQSSHRRIPQVQSAYRGHCSGMPHAQCNLLLNIWVCLKLGHAHQTRILAYSNKENDEKPLDLGRGNLLLLLFKRNKSICFPKFVPEHRRIIQNPTFGGSCLWSPDQLLVGLGGRLPVVCLATCSSEPVNAASRNKVRWSQIKSEKDAAHLVVSCCISIFYVAPML